MIVHTSEETGSSTVSTAQSNAPPASRASDAGSPSATNGSLSRSIKSLLTMLKSTSSAASIKLNPSGLSASVVAAATAVASDSDAVILLTANANGKASTTSEISAVTCASTKSTREKIPVPLTGNASSTPNSVSRAWSTVMSSTSGPRTSKTSASWINSFTGTFAKKSSTTTCAAPN